MNASFRRRPVLFAIRAAVLTLCTAGLALGQDPRQPGPLESFVQTQQYPRPGSSGPNRGEDVPFVCDTDGCDGNISNTEIIAEAYFPDPTAAAVQDFVAANGPMPLLIFLHGNHDSCYDRMTGASQLVSPWPCPGSMESLPSYRGYEYIGRLLASHGYVVASISANGINARSDVTSGQGEGITHRAHLIEDHLQIWNEFNNGNGDSATEDEPFVSQFENMVDLRRVGTMGHSRGGDGVVRHFELFSPTSPFKVKAVLPIAPTNFLGAVINNVPLGMLTGYCDGDVNTLEGLLFFDRARYNLAGDQGSKHTFLSMGSNHNFFNSIWTPECWAQQGDVDNQCWTDALGATPDGTSDDWSTGQEQTDDFCFVDGDDDRLTPAQQRDHALTYVSAFFRYYIGHENVFGPLLRGDQPPPAGVDPNLFVGYHPPALRRLDLNRLSTDDELSQTTLTNGLGETGDVTCRSDLGDPGSELACTLGFQTYERCGESQAAPCFPSPPRREAHRSNFYGLDSTLSRLRLAWDTPMSGTVYSQQLPEGARDVSLFSFLQFRVGVDFTDPPPGDMEFSIVLSDGANQAIVSTDQQLGNNVLFMPPGSYAATTVMNTVRIPLSAFSGVSFQNIEEVAFVVDGTTMGTVLLSDIAFTTEVENMASDIVMVIDRSGSMDAVDFSDTPDDRLEIARKGARFLAESLDKMRGHRVALVDYNSTSRQALDFVPVDSGFDPYSGAFNDALENLDHTGRTSIGEGLNRALNMLTDQMSPTNHRRPAVLLLTDGRQNEPRCLGIGDGSGGIDTGHCTPGGDPPDPITLDDPRLVDVPICSIGMGRTEGQVDEQVLENFSARYLDAQPNGGVPSTAMAEFGKCIPDFAPEGMAVDPAGILATDDVSAPAHTYDSAGDTQLTFASSWSNTVDTPGDMRLFVNRPGGDLVAPTSPIDNIQRPDYHNIFERDPEPGTWRFQVGREKTRIVNGFTSNAFVDGDGGVRMVRRQVQHLCPDGCDQVLYFEDGRMGSEPSVYAQALSAEQGAGLVTSVESYDASGAASFATALNDGGYDLLVYVHQLDGNHLDSESYDATLASVLCNTDVPAIITDTRGVNPGSTAVSANLGLVSSLYLPTPLQFHACSGAWPSNIAYNYATLVNNTDTLLDANLSLVNQGYEIFSYSLAPLPFDNGGAEGVGATQLEAANEVSFTDTSQYLTLDFGAITTFSADQPFTCAFFVGAECYAPRARGLQRWASQVNFEGLTPIKPVLGPAQLGDPDGVRLKFILDRFLPPGGIIDVDAFVEVVYPTVGLDVVLGQSGCFGDSFPNGDFIPGSTASVALENIPTASAIFELNDEGLAGDEVAGDLCFSTLAASLGQVTGTYQARYYVDITYLDDDGVVRTMHREEIATQYVGDEVESNGRLCTPTGAECDVDTQPPVIDSLGLSDVTAASTCSHQAQPLQLQVPAASDNCGSATVSGTVIASSNPSVSVPLAISGGSVSLPPGVFTIEWVATDGSGNLSAPFVQTLSIGTGISASESIHIRDGSQVLAPQGLGSLSNLGTGITEVGNGSRVGGLQAGGNVKVWHNAEVDGDILAAGFADVEPSAMVSGVVVDGASLTAPAPLDLSAIEFPPVTAGTIQLNAGQSLTLAPGAHPVVVLNSQSELILEPGDHFFEEFYVNSDSVIVTALEGARVFVRTAMAFRASFVDAGGNLAPVLLGFAGSNDLNFEANFIGTVIAPNATVLMGTANAQSFSGSVHARSIDLRNNADFTCIVAPCVGTSCDAFVEDSCNNGIQDGDEEGIDCGGSCPQGCAAVCNQATYEAETMFHSTGGSTPGGWNIWSNGYISTSHDFTAGPARVTVKAKGQAAFGIWPHMVVSVGGAPIGNVSVTSSTWAPYVFDFTAGGGPQELRVTFDNDVYLPPHDRNLFIDNAVVECVGP